MADVLIGAIGYINRELTGSKAKVEFCELFKTLSRYSLKKTTLYREPKVNIFIWAHSGAAPLNNAFDWLPELMLEADYSNWNEYEDALYAQFQADFIHSSPRLHKQQFKIKRHPQVLGRIATFWHLISRGNVQEDKRLVDRERCSRMKWVRVIIDRLATHPADLRIWRAHKQRDNRLHIALSDFSYIVVLADRGDFVLLWTAFVVEHKQRQEGYRREWLRYQASKNA